MSLFLEEDNTAVDRTSNVAKIIYESNTCRQTNMIPPRSLNIFLFFLLRRRVETFVVTFLISLFLGFVCMCVRMYVYKCVNQQGYLAKNSGQFGFNIFRLSNDR